MKRRTDRRAILMAAGAAAAAVAAGPVVAQALDVRGEVTFEGDGVIPEGQLEVYLEAPVTLEAGLRRIAESRMKSDGKLKAIAFSFGPVVIPNASPPLQAVARLERADGWLLARGSAAFAPESLVHVTLKEVIY